MKTLLKVESTWLFAAFLAACLGCGPTSFQASGNDSKPNLPTKTLLNQVATPSKPTDRKIIYQADISINVNDFSQFNDVLVREVSRSGGFVKSFDDHGSGPSVRRGFVDSNTV